MPEERAAFRGWHRDFILPGFPGVNVNDAAFGRVVGWLGTLGHTGRSDYI